LAEVPDAAAAFGVIKAMIEIVVVVFFVIIVWIIA
jgi:hypothetical protein